MFPYQNVIGLEFKSNYEYYGTGTATSDQNLAKGYTLALAKQAPERCQKLPVRSPDCRRSADAVGRREGGTASWNGALDPASLISLPDGESCCCSSPAASWLSA